MAQLDPHYDRSRAGAIIAGISAGVFADAPGVSPPREITYYTTPVIPAHGSHLTPAQHRYLEQYMSPCAPEQIVSATHRITWTDSSGTPNTGYADPSGLGPIVPIAAREAVLRLWQHLAKSTELQERTAELSDADFAALAATTTDHDPHEILRIGVEAAGRALAQHALVATDVEIDDPKVFALAMQRSRLYATVASTWYWELQASTYRRGMIPVRLTTSPDGRIRYTSSTIALLSAMKKNTIADAQTVMHQAMFTEGLSPAAAIAKYHTELDVISRQYALLPADVQPICLAQQQHTVSVGRITVLGQATGAFTTTVAALLDTLRITERPAPAPAAAQVNSPFQIPDMNCRHCKLSITAILESHGATGADVDLVSKHVAATFASLADRDAAFAEIGSSGYTIVVQS